MGIFNCLASSAVSTDTYQPLARTDSGAQVRQTELHNLRLGKHTNPAIVGGEVLARQGECLVLSASRDSVGHLLPDKGCAADEVVSLSRSQSASPRYQNQGVSEPSKQLEASARNVEIGKGLNACYLSSYGPPASGESLRGLWLDKELGTARLQAFNRQLASTVELKVTYQEKPFREVDHVLNNVGSFLEPVDQLMAFVDGMTSFADRFAHDHVEGYGKDCLRTAPDSQVKEFVEGLLGKLGEDQKARLSTRLGEGVALQAQQIFTFAKEQVELPRPEPDHKLPQLGFWGAKEQAELLSELGFKDAKNQAELPQLGVWGAKKQAELLSKLGFEGAKKQSELLSQSGYEGAKKQAELSRLDHELSQLGFGVRVMKTLMEQLGLEAMTDVESVNVGDMDVYELAALDRVLKRA